MYFDNPFHVLVYDPNGDLAESWYHIPDEHNGCETNFLNFSSFNTPCDKADLVFSIGLLEHYDDKKQRQIFDLHCELSRKWVMIALPNIDSPLFQSFLKWTVQNNQTYPEKHESCSIQDLIRSSKVKLKIYDGCHIFLGRSKYYMKESSALCKFYDKIRLLLIEHGGEGYSKFPQIDFLKDDIKILKKIETRRKYV